MRDYIRSCSSDLSVKMTNLNFFLNAVVNLSFVLKFSVDVGEYQDYFSFNGNDNAAHLSRSNGTINLMLMFDDNYELYQAFNVLKNFTFDWDGYKINRQKMHLIKSSGRINQTQYDSFSFFSTEMEHEKEQLEYDCEEHTIYNIEEIDYKLLALIIFMIGLSLRSDEAIIKMWKTFKTVYNISNTNDFVTIREEIV